MGYKDDIVDQYPYLTYANEPGATIEDASGGGGGGGGGETVSVTIAYTNPPTFAPTATAFLTSDGAGEDVPIELTQDDQTHYGGRFPIGAAFAIAYGVSGLSDESITFNVPDFGLYLPFNHAASEIMITSIIPMYDADIAIDNSIS